MESHRYRSDGFEAHALVRDGRDPAVVLLHGAAGNALGWLPLLPAFEGRRLVLVDLPGHGESPPVESWSLERLARNLVDAIGREHAGALVWGGHSWGGKTAAILGALFPERARALLLVDPSPASPVPITAEDFVAGALAPEIGPWGSMAEAHEAARALPHYAAWSEDLRRVFERGLETRADGAIAARAQRDWLVAVAAAALTHDDSAAITRLACPTLLAIADQSLFWQERTNLAVLGGLPNVETVTLPGHHWLHWCAVDALAGRIRPWLDEVMR